MTSEDPRQPQVFWGGGVMAAKMFVSLIVFLFGALALFGALDRIGPGFDLDATFLLVFGAVISMLGFLMFRFFLNPRVKVTDRDLFVRGFFKVKWWSLLEIDSISTRKEKLKPHKRTAGRPLVIEWIVLHLRNGSDEKFIAPQFVGNDRLLDILSLQTNKRVDRDTRSYDEIPIGK